MSSIDKLMIQGVRSFSPFKHQVIEFDKRLTLIVGHNGAGKTTIIEALKYITTQSLPPGVTKADWIHDPKLAQQATVSALIKLRFRDQAGNVLTAARRMEVKQTERTKTFKEVSAELKLGKESITARCADLTKEIVTRLGVSKAIIEHVIFCHQEESDWPLAEPKKLKEKFDAIFDATRFKVAQDVIKKTITEQGRNFARVDEAVKHLADKRDAAKALKAEFDATKDKLVEQARMIEEIEGELKPHEERWEALQSVFRKIRSLDEQLSEVRTRREGYEAQLAELENSVEVRDTDTVALTTELREFTRVTKEKEAQLVKERQKLDDVKGERDVMAALRSDLQTKLGALKHAKENHVKAVAARDRKVAEVASSMNMAGYAASPLTKQQVDEVVRLLTNQVTQLDNDIKAAKRAFDGANRTLQSKVDAAKAAITKNRTSQQDAEERRAAGRIRKQNREKERREISVPGDTLAQLQQERASVEADLTQARNDAKASTFEKDMAAKKGEKKKVEDEVSQLQSQLDQVNLELEKRTRIEARQRELDTCKSKLAARKSTDASALEPFFGTGYDDADLADRYEAARAELQGSVRSADGVIEDARRRLSSEESAKAVATNKLDAALKEQQMLRSELSREIGESGGELNNFEEVVAQRQERAEVEQAMPALLKLFSNWRTKINETHECPVCSCDLEEHQLMSKALAMVEHRIGTAETRIQSNQTAEESYKRALELRSRHTRYMTLTSSDVPDFQAEAQRVSDSVNHLRAELVEAEEVKRERVDRLHQLETLQSTCAEVARLATVIRETEPEIQHERDTLYMYDDTVTPDSLNCKIRELNDRQKHIDSELDAMHEDRSRKTNKIGQLQSDMSRLDNAVSQHRLAVSKREQLEKDIQAIDAEERELNEKVKTLARAQPALQGALEAASREQANAAAAHDREMHKLQKEKRAAEDELKAVEDLTRVVDHYTESGKDKELERCEAELERKAEDLRRADGAVAALTDAISDITDLLSRKQLEERSIRDNLKLRELQEEVRALKKQQSELKDEKKKFDSENKVLEIETLEAVIAQYRAKKAESQGKSEQLRSTLRELQDKLKLPMYKQADDKYRESLIKKKATETAIADLKKYFNALEESILRFHAIKMREINRTIRELWEQTYTGGDIDYIEIVSADEDAPKKSAQPIDHSKRKSYSYSVMMWKGHTRMRFRGQCSAGQKVLACIIIRLALADTFCLSCGILTLDEPTTNLDADNIDALAESLSRLIEHRSRQTNFQLIIITHDEDFVQKLGRSGVADEYYKIMKQRDEHSDLMVSTIRRTNIATMQNAGAEDHE